MRTLEKSKDREMRIDPVAHDTWLRQEMQGADLERTEGLYVAHASEDWGAVEGAAASWEPSHVVPQGHVGGRAAADRLADAKEHQVSMNSGMDKMRQSLSWSQKLFDFWGRSSEAFLF